MANVSTFMGLQTALRGLLAQQAALDTTGHNISNANTEGYSRQEAVMTASLPLDIPANAVQGGAGAQVGTGVDVQAYQRIRDSFLDLQYRAQNMQEGDLSTRSTLLQQAQGYFSEPGDNGIAAQLQRFWSAWSDVANAPESPAARQALVTQGQTLASMFSQLDSSLSAVQQQAGNQYSQITGSTGDVASYAQEISQLNTSISAAVSRGESPNDLMDRRDLLIDKLSALAQVTVSPTSGMPGSEDITFGGVSLVTGGSVASGWAAAMNTAWTGGSVAPTGQLGALFTLASATGPIAGYRAQLNGVAKQLADSVNTLHSSGGGPDFFTYTSGSEASTLAVNVTASQVVTSTTSNAGANDIAQQIAALRGGTADALYQTLVGQVGSDVSTVGRQEANSQVLLNTLSDRRDSTSGVSLDEEMSNLIRFQRGYQASARTMTAMDDLLDQLINRTGKVGL